MIELGIMKTLPKIKELKKKLSKKIKFTKFYKKLFNKIQIQDQHIKSFININQKTNFHKNTSLPLQNIPIAIKDLVHLKGLKCTSGSLVFKNRFSTKNAKIVNRLLRAGSQIIGKNNLVEFAYGSRQTRDERDKASFEVECHQIRRINSDNLLGKKALY